MELINNIAKALGVLVELESVLGKGMTYIRIEVFFSFGRISSLGKSKASV